jgi:hypothetical protein
MCVKNPSTGDMNTTHVANSFVQLLHAADPLFISINALTYKSTASFS